jgi:ABC-type transport system involved in cytochrome c biogenesis permease subunit
MKLHHVLIIAALVLATSVCAFAGQKLDMADFKRLPIQHEGRLKPLGSYAQVTLKTISGDNHLKNISAEDWLAVSIFDPQAAAELEIFTVPDKTLREQLQLDPAKKLYSFAALAEPLNRTLPELLQLSMKAESERTPTQTALLTLHEHAALYTKLLRSFSAILPLAIDMPGNNDQPATFRALEKEAAKLDQKLKKIIKAKGTDPAKYNEDELKIANAAFSLNQIRQGGENNDILRVIPVTWENEKGWVSPWAIFLEAKGAPQNAKLLESWSALANAYREGDATKWNASLAEISNMTAELASYNQARLDAEIFYRAAHPYNWVIALYVLSFAAACAFRGKNTWPLTLGFAAIIIHIGAIALRIYILGRPPVGTLYESVLFVSLIGAGLGLFFSHMRNTIVPLIAGTFAAASLLLIAPIALPGGDSLEVLVAVLNTNFWLATHVICITAGYGICILCACLAHALLAMKEPPATLQQNLYHISLLALMFMVIGTVLGGIWADQSWGRFWGWDPKENGALLICLWLIWVQHGRVSKYMSTTAFTAMLAALNIIVALSWFGVNLLSVGLHSYGFTSGMASGLAIFCTIELLLISGLWYKGRKS